jgi:hypothetical protein
VVYPSSDAGIHTCFIYDPPGLSPVDINKAVRKYF